MTHSDELESQEMLLAERVDQCQQALRRPSMSMKKTSLEAQLVFAWM